MRKADLPAAVRQRDLAVVEMAREDEVVRTIVSTLVGRVQAADVERSRRKPPASLAAYECVLQGNALTWSDPAGAAAATRLFERAIELDPDYGFAHALLAVMRYREWYYDLHSPDTVLDESFRLATRAVALASSESTCFSILSQVCLFRRSFDAAAACVRAQAWPRRSDHLSRRAGKGSPSRSSGIR